MPPLSVVVVVCCCGLRLHRTRPRDEQLAALAPRLTWGGGQHEQLTVPVGGRGIRHPGVGRGRDGAGPDRTAPRLPASCRTSFRWYRSRRACQPARQFDVVVLRLMFSWVRNLPRVAFAPSNCLAFLPALAGSISTTPLPSVMMPEVRSLLRGRLTTVPQMSTERATCQCVLAEEACSPESLKS